MKYPPFARWWVPFTGILLLALLAGCGQPAIGGTPLPTIEATTTAITAITAPDQSGTTAQQIVVAGLTRTYLLHRPPALATGRPLPLVLAFHGGGGQGASMIGLTGLSRIADREGFVVAYPDGLERHWNDGRSGARTTVAFSYDDVTFVKALITHLTSTLPIDPARVYATGMSNGAIFSHRLACDLPDQIAAIGVVAGSLAEALVPNCTPARAVPVVLIMGEADPLVPWAGGRVSGPGAGNVLSVPATVAHWAQHNGCAPSPTVTHEPDRAPTDGTTVRRESYTNCRADADVTLYAVVNGGHAWPGGPQYLPERTIGKSSRDIEASTIIWAFFAAHPRR